MDLKSYQARAQAANGNYQNAHASSETGARVNVSGNLMTANMSPQFSTTNSMQPYRPTAAVAPSQAQQLTLSRPAYYKDSTEINIAQIKPYQSSDNARNAFQPAMGSFPYEYRQNDPRATPPHPQNIYSTPPPGAIYQGSQSRPSAKINPSTTGYYSSPGMPNGFENRNVYNGDHKPYNVPSEDVQLSRDAVSTENDSSRPEKDSHPSKDSTPSPKLNGGLQSDIYLQPTSNSDSQHTSPSDPFNPKNRILLPPHMPNEKGYIKQHDSMLPINAPKTPSPLVSNGARPSAYPPQNRPYQHGSPIAARGMSGKTEYGYGLPNSPMYNAQMAASAPANAVARKSMAPPPSPNHMFQQNRSNPNLQTYGYPHGNVQVQGAMAASSAVPGGQLNSSNATPSPTLNQLLTNTHPSQYKSTIQQPTVGDKNAPQNEGNVYPLNPQQQLETTNAGPNNNCDNSNHSESAQIGEYSTQSQGSADISNYMPSPSPSATSVSSLQEDESISSSHGIKPQMSPQVNMNSSAPHPQMMPPHAGGPPPPHSGHPQAPHPHMYHPHHHPSMGVPQMPGGQPPPPHMMHSHMAGQYNGSGPHMMQGTPMRHPVAPHQMQGMASAPANPASSAKEEERIDHFLYSLPFGQEPGRKEFCDRLIKILEARSLLQSKVPCVAKQPVDLFKLYNVVKEKSGFAHVCTQKLWKDIANTMDMNNSPMASYNMKKHYTKFLLPYECQYDLNGADPAAILAECDAPPPRKRPPKPKAPKEEGRGKKGKNANANNNAQGSNQAPSNSGASDTNGHTINVCDPFSDEFASSQRPVNKAPTPNQPQQSPPAAPPGYFPKQQFRQLPESPHNAYIKSYAPSPNDNSNPTSYGTTASGYRPSYGQSGQIQTAVPPPTSGTQQTVPSSSAASPYNSGGNRIPQGEQITSGTTNGYPQSTTTAQTSTVAMQPRRNSAFNVASENPPYPYPSCSGPKVEPPQTSEAPPLQPAAPAGCSNSAPVPASVPDNKASNTVSEKHSPTAESTSPTSVAESVKPMEESRKSPKKLKSETQYFLEEKQPYWRDSVEQTELEFGSIEATEIVCRPNTRVPAIYISHGDANKIMMSLKSGLKVETTWALETLTVILFDDVTMHHLTIDSLPGIVDCLLEHLQNHLDKLSSRHLKISNEKEQELSQESSLETANVKKTETANAVNNDVPTEERKPKNGILSPDGKKHDRKRKHEGSKELSESSGGCDAKRHSGELASTEPCSSNLETLLKLKAMSQTKEDRDASSYNCLHGEVLEALKLQRNSCVEYTNGVKHPIVKCLSRKQPKNSPSTERMSESCETFKCEQLLQPNEEEYEFRAQTVLSITNIFRSFSCLPLNEEKLAGHGNLLKLCSKLIQFAHWHPPKLCSKRKKEVKATMELLPDDWESLYLYGIRENCIVLLSNIAAKINLDNFDEQCVLSLMDALIHWLVCKSCVSLDPVTGAIHSTITMQRLALETLCKMCLAHNNTDYLLATPPSSRISELIAVLLDMVMDSSKPAIRELALVLLNYLSKSDIGVSQLCSVAHFVNKVMNYLHESVALIAKSGFNSRTSNPSSYASTSSSVVNGQQLLFDPSANLFMARSCSALLLRIAQLNPKTLVSYRKQILLLSTSEVFATIDTEVYTNLADILFELNS